MPSAGGARHERQSVPRRQRAASAAAADLRLLSLVDPALARLARIIKKGSDAVALRACQDILDRAHIGEGEPSPTVVTSVKAPPPVVDIGMIETDHLTDEQVSGGSKFLRALREAIREVGGVTGVDLEPRRLSALSPASPGMKSPSPELVDVCAAWREKPNWRPGRSPL